MKKALAVARKGIGLEVKADKTKYMFMPLRSDCRTKTQYED
jgi:hypothetical protein